MMKETTTLGGGCFWCLEAVFDNLQGVESVTSGYMGGQVLNPTYEQVCSGQTGHAEVVQIVFDPNQVSFKEILEVFFTIHDPTTRNRQGNDVGPQYRSVVFFHTPEQKNIAEETIKEWDINRIWDAPIVTQIFPAAIFYPAEEYHQNYFKNNPYQGYCMAVVAPKVAKFRAKFAAKMKK